MVSLWNSFFILSTKYYHFDRRSLYSLLLRKPSTGIAKENLQCLQDKLKQGINITLDITWTQDKVIVTNWNDKF